MRIRIIRLPSRPDVEGVSLSNFRVGSEYLVSAAIGTVLMLEGWAELVVLSDDPSAEDPPNIIRSRSPIDSPIVAAADARRRNKN
jgi:hypothetical protein